MSGRYTTRTHRAYVNWLNLVGHEYFHNWNVKRLRPAELGPFDYETETYTKALWVAEGFTDYYGALLVARAGLSTPVEYLDELSNTIEQVQMRPGRLVQPVDMASFDTWIKQYRPDENSQNTSIDFSEALDYYGLRFTPVDLKAARATLGASTRVDNGRLVVTVVRRGTPGHAAGLNTDDEILAIDDVRVRADALVTRMDQYRVGDTVRVLVARRDRLVTLDITLGAEPGRPWRLQTKADATAGQRANLAAWLGH